MITIEVQGFQSIACATIQVEGFTVLGGKSNIGKSAFIRAVRCALTNPLGTSFVRHGRDCARKSRKNAKTCDCFASVHITTDGFDLLWQKGDRVNSYKFNGKDYTVPGRGVPDFLVDAGLGLVKVGDKTGSIQVSDQFFPIFLLDQSGPAIAEAISDVSQLDNINSATKLAEKDRRAAMDTRKVREKDVVELEGRLVKYDTLDDKLRAIRDIESHLVTIEGQQGKVRTLARFLGAIESLRTDLAELDKAAKVEVPDSSDLVQVRSSAVQLGDFLSEASRRGKEVKALAAADKSLQDFPDDNPLPDVVKRLSDLGDWMARLRKLKESFASFEAADTVDIPAPDGLTAAVASLREMSGYAARGANITRAVTETQVILSKLDAEEQTISKDLDPLNKALSEIEVCPSCDRPMKGAHSHAETVFSFPD